MSIQLQTSPIGLSQLDPPVNQRFAYSLGQNQGGGDGLNFVTGNEVFQFSSFSVLGPKQPRAITSMWIDASAITAGKTLTIQCSNGQKFVISGGTQGYFLIPLPAPFTITVTTNNGAAALVFLILYNYNVAFTGQQNTDKLGSTGASSDKNQGFGTGEHQFPVHL